MPDGQKTSSDIRNFHGPILLRYRHQPKPFGVPSVNPVCRKEDSHIFLTTKLSGSCGSPPPMKASRKGRVRRYLHENAVPPARRMVKQ